MGAMFWWRSRKKVQTAILITFVILVILPIMPEAWWERMYSIGSYQEDVSAQGRLHAWRVAWEVGKHYFFGAGMKYTHLSLIHISSLVDNMPNSVLEAMASGIPVVSTNVGGVPFIVNDQQTALLVPARSPEAMAEAILRMMDDADLSEKLVNNALAEVNKYTWQRVWPLLADIYGKARHASRFLA